jgi:hypothetical protein
MLLLFVANFYSLKMREHFTVIAVVLALLVHIAAAMAVVVVVVVAILLVHQKSMIRMAVLLVEDTAQGVKNIVDVALLHGNTMTGAIVHLVEDHADLHLRTMAHRLVPDTTKIHMIPVVLLHHVVVRMRIHMAVLLMVTVVHHTVEEEEEEEAAAAAAEQEDLLDLHLHVVRVLVAHHTVHQRLLVVVALDLHNTNQAMNVHVTGIMTISHKTTY